MEEELGLVNDFKLMALALYVAYRALRNIETPVACIMVDSVKNEVLSIGFNGTNDTLNGTRHAEFIAIDSILNKHIPREKHGDLEYINQFFSKVVLYVTVEPCIMCASALKQLGIGKVVYGCGNDRFGGNGTVLMINNDSVDNGRGNYVSYGGILRTEAIQLLRNFYIQENETAPIPKIKLNKQIAEKEYPPNIKFSKLYTPEAFNKFYTGCNPDLFYKEEDVTYEISPGEHYSLNRLITIEDINRLPYLSVLYPQGTIETDLLLQDLEAFYSLFYDIKHYEVDFSKSISTIEDLTKNENKKRKL